jgi:DNA-binding GntR family transcriptional regulator
MAGMNDWTQAEPAPGANGLPLRDHVRERIRRGIADGRWTPGARLVERDLAAEFEVSRVPVREALQMLEREGFVELMPRRGAVVRQLTPAVVSDLFDIRQALEVLAARAAAVRIDDGGLQRLHGVLDEGRRALEADDHVWSGSANTAFHETILDLAGNEPLRDLLEPLAGRLKWLFRQTTDYARVQAEHEQLYAALAAGDAELAGAVALAHVRASRHMVLRRWSDDGRGTDAETADAAAEPGGRAAHPLVADLGDEARPVDRLVSPGFPGTRAEAQRKGGALA